MTSWVGAQADAKSRMQSPPSKAARLCTSVRSCADRQCRW